MAGRKADAISIVDGELVRRRRIEAGLSKLDLSKSLGVSPQVIDRLEHGSDQSKYEVAFLGALAQALGLALPELLRPEHPPVRGDGISADDVPVVGSLLFRTSETTIDDLARALDWTVARVECAVEGLAEELRCVGQCLHRTDNHLSLGSIATTPDIEADVAGASLDTNGLNFEQARLVRKLSRISGRGAAVKLDRISLLQLRAGGVVTAQTVAPADKAGDRAAEATRLSKEARYNLVLDQ